MDRVVTLFKIGAVGVVLTLASTAAEAKGCIKGAIVGGLGGHYVGRGMSSLGEERIARRAGHLPTILGAAVGCVAGRYEAQRRARAAARPAQPPPSRSPQTPAPRSAQPPALGSAQALHSRSIQSGR
jgi:hypothetical protein